MDEISLHNKINKLQSEMMSFHKKLSPVKHQEVEKGTVLHHAATTSEIQNFCIEIAFVVLKACVCVVGPAAFPAIIFCVEGSSPLFWQATAISCVISLVLVSMAVMVLCVNVEKFKCRIKNMFSSASKSFNKLLFLQPVRDIIRSELFQREMSKILHILVLLNLSILTSYLSYVNNIFGVFYGSLLATGFLCGILTSITCLLLSSPELRPMYSPCKIKMQVTLPSPHAEKVKRQLQFTSLETQNPSFDLQFSPSSKICFPEDVEEFSEIPPIKSVFPSIPLSTYQDIARGRTLQLPINFSNFFRRLSF